MALFEIGVFNSEVRQMVAEGDHHRRYTDDWADMRYIEIRAENEDVARATFETRHPKSQGFVLDSITEID